MNNVFNSFLRHVQKHQQINNDIRGDRNLAHKAHWEVKTNKLIEKKIVREPEKASPAKQPVEEPKKPERSVLSSMSFSLFQAQQYLLRYRCLTKTIGA